MTFFIATILSNESYECLVGLIPRDDSESLLFDEDKYSYYIKIHDVEYFDVKTFYHSVWGELINANLKSIKCSIDGTKLINIKGVHDQHFTAFKTILTNYMTRYYKLHYISYTLYVKYANHDELTQPEKFSLINTINSSNNLLNSILEQVQHMTKEEEPRMCSIL